VLTEIGEKSKLYRPVLNEETVNINLSCYLHALNENLNVSLVQYKLHSYIVIEHQPTLYE
jgi:hypothetical protein